MQRVGTQLVQAETPQRDEQVIAAHAREAGQREPLEQPLETALGLHARSPANALACELAAGASDPLA